MLPGKDGLTASGVGSLPPWGLLPPAPSQLGPFPWQKHFPLLNPKLESGRLGFAWSFGDVPQWCFLSSCWALEESASFACYRTETAFRLQTHKPLVFLCVMRWPAVQPELWQPRGLGHLSCFHLTSSQIWYRWRNATMPVSVSLQPKCTVPVPWGLFIPYWYFHHCIFAALVCGHWWAGSYLPALQLPVQAAVQTKSKPGVKRRGTCGACPGEVLCLALLPDHAGWTSYSHARRARMP